ncbi:Flp pilus assembly complex ATPase component TadA [Microaerobacter geothermalis]|uniref:GspE/PulE family protein n=1 Tax=Microaerobacter geothermalis TaxID=674972 RepID=UPI001F3E7BC2|nr:ATPase, T2SS/T4P/T4SS family [Microaerobacter geothermalis]MCF6092695.1 Flp pilus assembly complex ATPase component TadA [Microaerobacter geothermalis]
MTRRRIGDILVESGIITDQQLKQALQEQKGSGMKLGDLLIDRGYITEQQLIEVLEFQLGIPHVQLHRQKIDDKIINMIPDKIAKKHRVLPLRLENNKLIIAMSDPLDYYAIDDVRMSTGFQVEPVIASKEELNRAINRYYSLQETLDEVMQTIPKEIEETEATNDNAPIVRMVNQIISQAVNMGASDIHFDPQENSVKIRYRIDGILRTERDLPAHMLGVITARLKILSNLNIAERRLPQDGRFEMEVDYRKVDIRISTLPTIHGEKTVLRILDMANAITNIEKLGLSQNNLASFRKMISSAYGIILITGPTGSGKTTTLYAALSYLNSEQVNIITVEDPVEYQLPGINQVQVNTTTGLTFARGLRSILRQDPNIVMVGEIRDLETAEISVRAALTGHLVLSTLHTNDAVSTLNRLIDMGIEPFLVSSSIAGVVAQRLVRRICPQCRDSYQPSFEEQNLLEQYQLSASKLYRGQGCGSCSQTGYRGRLAIHEVLSLDEKMREMVMTRKSDSEYRNYAMSIGMVPMIKDGLMKAVEGLTTIQEVLRVTIE